MGGNTIPGIPRNPPNPDQRNTIPDWNPQYTQANNPGNPTYDDIPNPFSGINAARHSTQGAVHWKIQTIEPSSVKFKNFTVNGQFPVKEEGIKIHMSNSVPEGSVYGSPDPIIQWVKGNLQVISFDVVLYSRDKDEDIKAMWNQMMGVLTYAPSLKRPPLCRFTFGDIISVKCLVDGFGDVAIARPKPNDGKARKIEFEITLRKYSPYEAKQITSSSRVKESRMQQVSGDLRMYENLARREWGEQAAIYGDRLRKRNKGYPFAADENSRTKVPAGTIILNETIEPEWHIFLEETEEASELIQDKFNARNAKVLVV